jgi:nucleoside-diphosphate-sugar epimerase
MSRAALVLGAGGFLGAHVTRGLLDEGWDVTGVVRDPYDPLVQERLETIAGEVRLVAGDAGDPRLLERLAPAADAVFPFAGHSGAARSMAHVLDDLQANVAAQVALLETLRREGSPARVVFPGSRLQYGVARELPVDEDHPLDPTSPYGLSKSVAERYHRFYHDVHGVRTTSLRISLPYGPRQSRPDGAFGIVGTFLAAASRGGALTLYGGGGQIRDFVYVGDLVELFLLAATAPAAIGQVFNAGGPRPVALREMAEAVVRTVGRGRLADVPWPQGAAAVETGDFTMSLERVERELGWAPSLDLDEGLALTWAALEPDVLAAG